jgi:hypothetical protein
MDAHEGGCFCGDLRYRTSGDPQSLVLCHCHFCQKTTGGPYAVEVFFRKSAFELTSGTPSIYRHISTGSGKAIDAHFCPRCGTRVFTIFERYAEVMSVFGGTLDDPEWFEPAKATRHVYLDSARVGTVVAPGIDAYAQGSFGLDGTPNQPHSFSDFHMVRR